MAKKVCVKSHTRKGGEKVKGYCYTKSGSTKRTPGSGKRSAANNVAKHIMKAGDMSTYYDLLKNTSTEKTALDAANIFYRYRRRFVIGK